MVMPGRVLVGATGYRYGYNGKESDGEVKGNGNSLDFGARIYDSRLGRWLSCDALAMKYPNESPYIFSGDSPIWFLDRDGNVKVKCTNFIMADGSVASITTIDADKVIRVTVPYKSAQYTNSVDIAYDEYTTVTIDYTRLNDGKPTITSNTTLKEHSLKFELDIRLNDLNQKTIVTNEFGDPAGNTDDPFGQFSGNTEAVVSKKANGFGEGRTVDPKSPQSGITINTTNRKSATKDVPLINGEKYIPYVSHDDKDTTWQPNENYGDTIGTTAIDSDDKRTVVESPPFEGEPR